jgi:hypothetical protein
VGPHYPTVDLYNNPPWRITLNFYPRFYFGRFTGSLEYQIMRPSLQIKKRAHTLHSVSVRHTLILLYPRQGFPDIIFSSGSPISKSALHFSYQLNCCLSLTAICLQMINLLARRSGGATYRVWVANCNCGHSMGWVSSRSLGRTSRTDKLVRLRLVELDRSDALCKYMQLI